MNELIISILFYKIAQRLIYMKRVFRWIFIAYFFLLGIFSRFFAKFVIVNFGFPLLPTEVLILIWFIFLLLKRNKTIMSYPFLDVLYIFYLMYIAIVFILNGTDAFTIRLFIPFLYIVLMFITYDFINNYKDIELLLKIAKYSVLLAFILTILNSYFQIWIFETSTPGVYYAGVGSYGVFFYIFFVSIHSYIQSKNFKDIVYIIIIILWILFFALHRSAVLAIAIPIFFYFIRKINMRKIIYLITLAIVFGVLFIFLDILLENKQVGVISDLQGIKERILSIGRPEEDPNSSWRLYYWEQSLKLIFSNFKIFLAGTGFVTNDFELTSKPGDLLTSPFQGFHNSFLFIFFRIGLIGFLIILGIWLRGLLLALRSKNTLLFIHGLSLMSMFILAGFNVVFENPYHGFYIWFFLGAIYAIHYKKIEKNNIHGT